MAKLAGTRDVQTSNEDLRPKYYVLEMFPYPSGRIHMGHVRNYAMGDVSRGSCGPRDSMSCTRWAGTRLACLPKTPPGSTAPIRDMDLRQHRDHAEATEAMGLSIDWSREIATCDPSYYKHQQSMFLDMLEQGLVYRKNAKVNWDPVDQTVLANEQVIDGRGWRSNALVEQRELTQWFFQITAFSEDLLDALNFQSLAGKSPAHAKELDWAV